MKYSELSNLENCHPDMTEAMKRELRNFTIKQKRADIKFRNNCVRLDPDMLDNYSDDDEDIEDSVILEGDVGVLIVNVQTIDVLHTSHYTRDSGPTVIHQDVINRDHGYCIGINFLHVNREVIVPVRLVHCTYGWGLLVTSDEGKSPCVEHGCEHHGNCHHEDDSDNR